MSPQDLIDAFNVVAGYIEGTFQGARVQRAEYPPQHTEWIGDPSKDLLVWREDIGRLRKACKELQVAGVGALDWFVWRVKEMIKHGHITGSVVHFWVVLADETIAIDARKAV